MANIDVVKIWEFAIKNGAPAILLIWLTMQHLENINQQEQINDLHKLYRGCMDERIEDIQTYKRLYSTPITYNRSPMHPNPGKVAVLPKSFIAVRKESKPKKS